MITQLEELSMNAWPSLQTLLDDGWVLRFASGYTRRANSIHPIYASMRDINEKIAACAEMYRARNLRVVFKMTRAAQPEHLDEILERKGYASEAPTSVQVLDLRAVPPPTHRDVLLSEWLTQEWVGDYCRLNAVVVQHQATMRQMLANIVPARCFIALRAAGRVVAVGLGVAENGFVGLFDLVTDEEFRQRGLGTQLILNLLDWGKHNGSSRAYLQVTLNNSPALRLYEKLGFREVYQYWYRVKP